MNSSPRALTTGHKEPQNRQERTRSKEVYADLSGELWLAGG